MSHLQQPLPPARLGAWPAGAGSLYLGVGLDPYGGPGEVVWYVEGADHVATTLWRAAREMRVGTAGFGADLDAAQIVDLQSAAEQLRPALLQARLESGLQLVGADRPQALGRAAAVLHRLVTDFPDLSDGEAALDANSVCDRLLQCWKEIRQADLMLSELARGAGVSPD